MSQFTTTKTPNANPSRARWSVRLLACLALAGLLSMSIAHLERSEADALSSFDTELLRLINEHRAGKGLDPFLTYPPLDDASLAWSNVMLGRRNQQGNANCLQINASSFLIHDTPANIDSQGVPPGTTGTGENIAWSCGYPGTTAGRAWSYNAMPAKCNGAIDYTSPLMQYCQWVDSSLHRGNLESSSFTYIGLGTVSKKSNGNQTEPLTTARFAVAPAITGCDGLTVTIDMNTNGGNGTGTPGDDVILGTPGPDVIDAGDGNDIVCGEGGSDVVAGGNGNDQIFGGTGSDVLRGGPGNDTIYGQGGDDRVLGGIDDDLLVGGPGDDYLGGFGGADTIYGEGGHETIFGGYGADRIFGGDGNDLIHGLIGNDYIEGGNGDDILEGDAGSDTVNGGPGADTLNGGNAGDIVNGEGGDDSVSGGRADDQLSGGFGTDVCIGNKHFAGDSTDGSCETIFGVP